MSHPPQKVRELEIAKRVVSFDEVVLGYAASEALREAGRCLQCKKPTCISGCPVGIDIKKFIYEITQKDFRGAYSTLLQKNNFPSICGRICPAEYQCRRACVLTKKGLAYASREAINIHLLERFVGDYGIKHSDQQGANSPDKQFGDKKVAVVGSGPAGLCCAGELARFGIKVVIFEGLHKTGGVLRYGIPPFRLPRDIIDFEIDNLKKLGVEFITNFIVGNTKSLDELFSDGYSAVFLGLGAGTPSFLGLAGENLCNIYSANEFLTRINLMSSYNFPCFHTPLNIGRRVIVIGAGNTAMDAARCALRLQKINGISPDTTILYRRTEVEMPARRLEIEHAKEEGVQFEFLVQPVGFYGDEKGFIKRLKCLRCRLGQPDSSGRKSPVAIKGSDFEIEGDLVIVAVGLRANQILTKVTSQLKIGKQGALVVNPRTMETSVAKVFAAGDIVTGEATVIEAMAMAKKASCAILKGQN